jgi:hypothetical protein
MKWMCILLTVGVVNAGEVIDEGERARTDRGPVAKESGAIWNAGNGSTIVASSGEVAGWVAQIAGGDSVRTVQSKSGWRLIGPAGKSGEITQTGAETWLARYDGRSYTITRTGERRWRVSPRG